MLEGNMLLQIAAVLCAVLAVAAGKLWYHSAGVPQMPHQAHSVLVRTVALYAFEEIWKTGEVNQLKTQPGLWAEEKALGQETNLLGRFTAYACS